MYWVVVYEKNVITIRGEVQLRDFQFGLKRILHLRNRNLR